ncbi:putative oxidase protein [Neofusicoccum parvum]|uniref:Putative oxidase protein n=1 Tax=Botryosphaeria parva (strain UCR-NP2) TaxID=1287680 RepID=R1GJX3_BOTPV|nr:putative oxidase protein [Neofusicoccum parvum UCRNP2]GME32118.1 putative oxidase protein [Neofusicoccum parvum]
MKSSLIALSILASSTEVLGFPRLAVEQLAAVAEQQGENLPRLLKEKHEKLKRQTGFDAGAQTVSTTGEHAFVAPNFAAGDQRGPCPGLNAAANHGYIDHSGVDTFNNILAGVNEAYGMALDLAAFLAIYGTVFDGNPVSLNPGYSIGGWSPRSQNILGNGLGLLGQPEGLSGSHNKYESDSSPTRGDMYLFGDAFRVQVPQAQQYVDNTPTDPISAPDWYDSLFEYRISRFDDSINRNGHFFFSPFAGVLVAPAGYSFPPAMMSNHSAEYPEGYMTKEIFKQFFSLGGADDSVTYTEGFERIPENWYKRAIGDEYTIAGFLADVLSYAIRDPRLLSVGGNTGEPNTFTPVDIGDLTGGVFNAATLLEGNNLECFVFQAIMAAAPDVLGGGIITAAPFKTLSNTLLSSIGGLGCPQLNSINNGLYDKYPGYDASQGAV